MSPLLHPVDHLLAFGPSAALHFIHSTFYATLDPSPMTIEPAFVETRLAIIERSEPDVIVVRYREDIAFDNAGIAEVIAVCERLPLREEFAVITMLPMEGEMSLEAMQVDHSSDGFGKRVRAHALVVGGELFRRLSEIHYNYHPQQHEVRPFADLDEARIWVREQLGDRSVA